MEVLAIPALSDNYIWCLADPDQHRCVIVDPGEAAPVLATLKAKQLELSAILITHHHWDHCQGVPELISQIPVPVYGPALEPVAGQTHPLNEGDQLSLLDGALSLNILHIPGHTLGHIAYFNEELLLSGDTLFTAGCGKIFEGTAEQMLDSLNKLAALPDHTLVYCGHEYTAANLKFALAVEPHNPDIQQRIAEVKYLRSQNHRTVPAPLSLEKRTNPFLRCKEPSVIEAAQHYANTSLNTTSEVLATIRQWKNHFF
jgi:hydroxyacylglutathione hydrolase